MQATSAIYDHSHLPAEKMEHADGSASTKKTDSPNCPRAVVLCASCDSCRKRKTRCDGKRPCSNCQSRHMKKHGLQTFVSYFSSSAILTSLSVYSCEEIPLDDINCVYSPAKRRGPVPKQASTTRKRPASATAEKSHGGYSSTNSSPQPSRTYSPPSQAAAEHNSNFTTNHSTAEISSPSQSPSATSITALLPLLCSNHHRGNQLRNGYNMVFASVIPEPPPCTTAADSTALTAGQFLVLALGALVDSSNPTGDQAAVVMYQAALGCVRQARTVHHQANTTTPTRILAHVYLLLGVWYLLRGDIDRYVQCRRQIRMLLSLNSEVSHAGYQESREMNSKIMGSISYLNSWIYMLYNGNTSAVPRLSFSAGGNSPQQQLVAEEEQLYWTRGGTTLFLDGSMSTNSRVLDALACVFRLGTDQARNCTQMVVPGVGAVVPTTEVPSPLGPRNLLLAAYQLLEQGDGEETGRGALRWMVAALDACLAPPAGKNGFTETQINALLTTANACIQQPAFLWIPGPSFHVASNLAVLLAHASNAFVKQSFVGDHSGRTPTEQLLHKTVQQELCSTYTALTRLLTLHRARLPSRLQCHLLPTAVADGTIPILQHTTLCACNLCQGFVLASAVSPAVAKQLLVTSERQRVVLERMELVTGGIAWRDGTDDDSDVLQSLL